MKVLQNSIGYISARRAKMLQQTLLAIHAARLVLAKYTNNQKDITLEDSAYLALPNTLSNTAMKEIDLNMIIESYNESVVRFKKLPQFPEVQRDLAVIVPDKTSWDELEKIVKKGVSNNVFNGCEVFDVYQGEHVQDGFKSVAFRIKMQDANSTMTDDAIETQMANVRATLKKAIPDLSFRE